MTDSPVRTALVTSANAVVSGATGFLGSRLVVHLQKAGFHVRVLARQSSRLDNLAETGAEIVYGDLQEEDSLRRAVRGRDCVFHCAGKVSDWGKPADFFAANTRGTINIIDACRRESVPRLIHTSSLSVLGLPRDGAPVNEETVPDPPPRDPYSASKLAAERYALAHHGRDGLAITVIRPGVIWGRGEKTILPRIARLIKQGRMVYIGRADNLLGLSHVDNLCRGLIQAVRTPDAAGRIYHLTDGEEITARRAVEALAGFMGVDPPRVSLPFPLVYLAALLSESMARVVRTEKAPALTRYGVRLLACSSRYDISRAREELAYAPAKTFAAGLAEMDGTDLCT